jgi:NADPH:quinone reductase-like Zn-dependent oxidoreductase
MRAIVHSRYGPPDHLAVRSDVPLPDVGPTDVLVRVAAASLNAGDWRLVRGSPALVRLGAGLRRPRDGRLGVDVAGDVERVGDTVTGLVPGQPVFGMVRAGALAEYASGLWFVPMPAGLTYQQAAAVPAAGCTALQAVRQHALVRPGMRVMVIGAGGGVGTFAVQIARADGAAVTAVSRASAAGHLDALDLDRLVATRDLERAARARQHDVIIDVGGHLDIGSARAGLAPGGRLVLVGAGAGPGGPVTRFIGAAVRARVLRQPVTAFIAAPRTFLSDLQALAALLEAGAVRPVIDAVVPLERTAEAIRTLERRLARGKVVVTVQPGRDASRDREDRGD